jgi:hypothetical protein
MSVLQVTRSVQCITHHAPWHPFWLPGTVTDYVLKKMKLVYLPIEYMHFSKMIATSLVILFVFFF